MPSTSLSRVSVFSEEHKLLCWNADKQKLEFSLKLFPYVRSLVDDSLLAGTKA